MILLQRSEVPDTDKVVRLVIAPSMSAFPVKVIESSPSPATADAVLIVLKVLPSKVLLVKVLSPLTVIPAVAVKVWSPIELIS